MNTIHSDQKNGPGRAGAAHWGQSPIHIPAHGERGVGSPGIDAYFLPRSTGGDLNRSRPFSIHVTLRPSPVERHRQRAGANPLGYRLSATFIRRCRLARGPQFGFPQHVSGKSSNAAKSHVVNASLVRWFNATRHRTRHDGTLPNHPRELQKHNGAPQHECC